MTGLNLHYKCVPNNHTLLGVLLALNYIHRFKKEIKNKIRDNLSNFPYCELL